MNDPEMIQFNIERSSRSLGDPPSEVAHGGEILSGAIWLK
jgi:hypothetical protein